MLRILVIFIFKITFDQNDKIGTKSIYEKMTNLAGFLLQMA